MLSNTRSEELVDLPPAPTVADHAAKLAAAVDCLRASERFVAKAVRLLGETARSGVCEAVEGLPLDLFLTNTCRLIGADRSTLLTASDVLVHMPRLQGLFEAGEVSWGQVRTIARTCARLDREDRGLIDRRLQATMQRWNGLDGFHPDQLLHEVDRAVDRLLDPQDVAARERHDQDISNYLAVQPRFDGGMRFFGEADPLTAAPILDAWEAAAKDLVSVEDQQPDSRRSRARRRFRGLLHCSQTYLAGGPGRPARPNLNVIVDLDNLHVTAAGQLETRLPGCLPRLTARLTDLLARDADIRAVVFDGARPLATSRKQSARDIPDEVRIAVALRDRGDRFPGSDLPLSDSHVHHILPREEGGTHLPENLVTLGARSHLHSIHTRGWRPRLDPDTGTVTVTRDGRTFRSHPRGTPLEPPPDAAGTDPPSSALTCRPALARSSDEAR